MLFATGLLLGRAMKPENDRTEAAPTERERWQAVVRGLVEALERFDMRACRMRGVIGYESGCHEAELLSRCDHCHARTALATARERMGTKEG